LSLLAFALKSIEEYDVSLMRVFHTIALFTKKIENDFITIVKGIPFNGFIKMSPCGNEQGG
jgi:hypothetical protein